jgi:VIT1/CCC1 family predicted Fe2+/Mn2+ transporter
MVALVGCNIAWGVIDAVFYLMGSLFSRNRRVRFVRQLQAAASDEEAISLIREEFALGGEPPTRAEDRAAFHRSVLEMLRHASAQRAHFRSEEFAAAAIILVLVSLTALPGLIPLLLIDHVDSALRSANALQVVLLFVIGYRWAHYAGTPGWRGAMIVGLLGVALVLVAVALGG